MDLCINTILERLDSSVEATVDRVIGFSADGGVVILIGTRGEVMPRNFTRAEIEDQLAAGQLRVMKSDPHADLSRREDEIPESHRIRRDRAWSLIQPIIELPDGGAFSPKQRGPVINRICRETGTSKWIIYMHLRRYWQGGLRRNALLPKFKNCGGPGKNRRWTEAKRGRRRKLTKLNGAPPGVNVTEEMRGLFRLGIKAFYENEELKLTLREAYQRTLERYMNRGYELVNDIYSPITPLASEVPTFEQFHYWHLKDGDTDQAIRIREGKRRYDLRHRALGGDASLIAFGPGSVFQIDSTIADIYLVSVMGRTRIIGRPTLYLMVDVFTRMIVGFCAVIENASYGSAALALENAAQDKVEFCAKFGIKISEFEWPSAHFSELLVADRAEMLGKNSNHLIDAFGFRIANTPPHRADLKPFIERLFHSINQELIHSLPGAVRKKRERGDRDYRLDASLTLNEFRKAVIYFILHHNRSRVEGYRPRDFMVADEIEPRPVLLWQWGIQNRSGHLLKHDPEFVRQNLLPGEQATVTERGIRFRNLYYTCSRAVAEHWFATARQKGSWRIDIAYDPRQTAIIYLRLPNLTAPEQCQLMGASSQYSECSWEDVEDFFSGLNEMKDRSRTPDMQEQSLYHAQIDDLRHNARARTAAARDGQSRAAKIRGIRANRQVERELDRRGTAVENSVATAGKPLPPTENHSGAEADGYVGLPTDFETLEQQRDELCKS
ncbi:MAG TPA: Mu transposase C-terminal domain-containing protein [Verrucomicrobiae bacterium]|jgi:hypothetical protein|nr:Mu transposase C-terminal domain-containing protein [Verrucomicrobiae bacterium]